MKKLVVASNMFNEHHQLEEWFAFVKQIADAGIVIVDTGSTDGTIEYAREQGAVVIIDDIILREGYGPARNHLREMSIIHFPKAHWMIYLDGDERILEKDFHNLRFTKDYLIDAFDVVALPRVDWMNKEMTEAAKDWRVYPDWQARMSRLNSGVKYIRRLHEQIEGHKAIYTNLNLPKINHFHRSAGKETRDRIGRICAKLHAEDQDYGHTYPKHPKEDLYYEQYKKEGL